MEEKYREFVFFYEVYVDLLPSDFEINYGADVYPNYENEVVVRNERKMEKISEIDDSDSDMNAEISELSDSNIISGQFHYSMYVTKLSRIRRNS